MQNRSTSSQGHFSSNDFSSSRVCSIVVCWALHLILDPLLHILEGVTRNLKTINMEGKSKAIFFFQNHETDKKVLVIICIVKLKKL